MAQERVEINSKCGLPVGRMVMGSLYKPNTTDFDGKPLLIKTGPNAGQPRVSYFFAIAIPKGQERHWAETSWGAKIWAVGHQAFPQAAQRPDFAWKIEDGDSQVPNKKNRRPCDTEGWPGHWILKLSGGFAPKVYRIDNGGYVQVIEDDFVKPGYFIEVSFSVDGNGQQNNPGVYLNHSLLCFRAYGPEIVFGPDVNEAGFGASPLPAGASLQPPVSSAPLPSASAPVAQMPPAPAVISAPPATPVPVYPNPGFVQMPPAPAVISAPPAPPVAPVAPIAPAAPAFQMTAKAAGSSREAFMSAGWTDAQLIQQGYMTA
jgi:hypothetical protein